MISNLLYYCRLWARSIHRFRRRKNVQTDPKNAIAIGSCRDKPSSDGGVNLHERLKKALFRKYEFRFNVLTEQVEYRLKGGDAGQPFIRLDKRMFNTLVIEMHEVGITCWNQDVERLLKSKYVDSFHPFYAYMQSLPPWDGQDRILPLALRIDADAVWVNGFRRWLLALASQWMGHTDQCANTLIPMLISPKQGMSKSTFCRLLMPPSLSAYYLDKFDLNAKANVEMKLGLFGLINLDEFDRYSNSALATLKNLVQIKQPTVRKSYAGYYIPLQRIASFIGTSNQMELLNDPTGSRRFLCIEVKRKIDCSPIDHAQLFAQLKSLVERGERVWMDTQEEMELQMHNQVFSRLHPEEEVFYELYDIPKDGEKGSLVTVTEIHRKLCRHNPAAMRGIFVQQLGRTLSSMGVRKQHTKIGTKYDVLEREQK